MVTLNPNRERFQDDSVSIFPQIGFGFLSMMRCLFPKIVLGLLLFPVVLLATDPGFNGRWRLDTSKSTALDGWTAMDLVVSIEGDEVALQHDMRWRSTRVTAINRVNTDRPIKLRDFFRIEQRHMAVYRPKDSVTPVTAVWLDGGRTLRVEAYHEVETSQGNAEMRITSEYRLEEGDETLTLIELHSTRDRPLVYVFRKLAPDDTSKP
jgi:hypothetical protein